MERNKISYIQMKLHEKGFSQSATLFEIKNFILFSTQEKEYLICWQ